MSHHPIRALKNAQDGDARDATLCRVGQGIRCWIFFKAPGTYDHPGGKDMNHQNDTPRGASPAPHLRTPEQVAEDLGRDDQGNYLASPFTIRRMVRERRVAYTKLARNRIAFTPGQVTAMVELMSQPVGVVAPAQVVDSPASPFTPSSRSAARRSS
jgi:hypothetical protein